MSAAPRWGAMPKQAILFDIDGTLVDSNDAHIDAWLEAFRSAGFAFSRAQIHEQIGKGGDNLLPTLAPDLDEDEQEKLDEAHGELFKRLRAEVKPFPGGAKILERAAAAGQKVVLASSASRDELDHWVEMLGAKPFLTATTSRDDVEHSKPCPDIFAKALEKSGCASPGDAVVVGDTPYDIIAARQIGVPAIGVRSGGFADGQLNEAGAVALYDDVAELLADYESSPLSR
ncbi:MAG: HAD family hydrolase [Sphingomonas sp.]|nr:HAD family hydrolase [Sphingomonas sp.]